MIKKEGLPPGGLLCFVIYRAFSLAPSDEGAVTRMRD